MAHPKFWLTGHTAFDGTNNCAVICSLILRKIGKTWCHQMSDLRAKMHQVLFRWGSAPDPTGGAYSAPPDLAVFKGPSSKGREKGEGRKREGNSGGWADRVAAPPIDQNLGAWSWLR